MHYYCVKFDGTVNKEYIYSSKKILPIKERCTIIADEKTTYDNPVTIIRKISATEIPFEIKKNIREITSYQILYSRRPDDRIKNVYFNEEKGVTCVVWYDGKTTIIRCQPGDTWDKEKALALCYMKRFFNNRSCFNETLKKYCYD